MPNQYWKDGSLQVGPPGIRIIEATDIEVADELTGRRIPELTIKAPKKFQEYTKNCLNLLLRTHTGNRIIEAIARENNCSIAFSPGNSAGVGNARASMTLTAYEVLKSGPGDDTRLALRRSFTAHGARYAAQSFQKGSFAKNQYSWLAGQINRQPTWNLEREPGSAGGISGMLQSLRSNLNQTILGSKDETEGYFDDQLYMKSLDVSAAGLATTPKEIQLWMENKTMPTRFGQTHQQQFRLATIVALEEFSSSGGGSPSSIRFATGAADKLKDLRPPAIALGHELLHAYHSLRGKQPGEELSHFSTTLFEFKCVGLGPWNENALSENGLRQEWAKIAMHAHDAPNQRAPGKRIRY